MRLRYGDNFAADDRRRSPMAKASDLDGVKVTFHPATDMCLVLRSIAVEADGLRICCLGRLQGCCRSDLRAVRTCSVRRI